MTINEIQDNVIEEFSAFDDWMDKYSLLIDLGNSLPALDERYKTESNLIEGCQSRVWLQADYVDGKIIFQGESDAVIFHREDRTERTPLAHPFEWSGGDGQANASVCSGFPCQGNGIKSTSHTRNYRLLL